MFPTLLDLTYLWKCVWQTTLCLGLGIGASFLFLSRPARAHRVLMFALVTAFVTPLLSQTVHHYGWGLLRSPTIWIPSASQPADVDVSLQSTGSELMKPISTYPESNSKQESVPRIPQRSLPFSWLGYLVSVWVALSVLASIRLVRIFILENQILRETKPCENPSWRKIVEQATAELELRTIPRVVESDRIHCPAMWCWGRRPALLIPKLANIKKHPREWQGIILHELAHWKRRDHIAQLLGEFFICVFPWNAVGWYTRRRLIQLSEQACDDWALAKGGSADVYAESLLALVPHRRPALILATGTTRHGLQQRIRHILRSKWNDPTPGRLWTFSAVVIMICITTAIALTQTVTDFPPLRGLSEEIVFGLGELEAVALSPDGQYALTGSRAGAFMWDTTSGEMVRTFWLAEACEGLDFLGFSPDGILVIAKTRIWMQSTITVWDAETGEKLYTFDWADGIDFSPDGTRIVTSGHYGNVTLWDANTGEQLRAYNLRDLGPWGWGAVAFSPDGTEVLIRGRVLAVWDPLSGMVLRTYDHINAQGRVAYSPDGAQILTGHEGGFVTLWDVATGEKIRIFGTGYERMVMVAFSSDGAKVFAAERGGRASLFDTATGKRIRSFDGKGWCWNAAFSSNGLYVLTAGREAAILYDAVTGKEVRKFLGHTSGVTSAVYSPGGEKVLLASEPISLWESISGRFLKSFGESRAWSLAFSPDGSAFAAGYDGTVTLWNTSNGQVLREITVGGSRDRVMGLAFSPDGEKIVSACGWRSSQQKAAILWDAVDGRKIREFNHRSHVTAAVFSTDGRRLLTGCANGTATLWHVETGEEIQCFTGHTWAVMCVALSSDGTKALTGCGLDGSSIKDRSAKLWDTATGIEIRTFIHEDENGNNSDVYAVNFSTDSKMVVTGSSSGTVKLWETTTGALLQTYAHGGEVWSSVFSPDGKHVLTGSWDGTARIWDISEIVPSTRVREFRLHEGEGAFRP